MSDLELFEVKNSFYIGNFQQCITEAQRCVPKSPENVILKDVFMYRAYIAQKKYNIVKTEISQKSPTSLQAILLLAQHISEPHEDKSKIVEQMENWLCDEMIGNNPIVKLVAGLVYFSQENYDDCMRILHDSNDLECCGLMIACLLKIHRIQAACKELSRMQQLDDDATLTHISHALVDLHLGNSEKYQEAFYIYQELCEKFIPTPFLLNGKAVCLIHLARFQEAEAVLLEGLEKDPNHCETLANLVVVSTRLNKSRDIISRYFSHLKESNADLPFCVQATSCESLFDQFSQRYSPQKLSI
eukprot:Sdes_comp20173_c0_seq1m13382